jgi:hypothetical protein
MQPLFKPGSGSARQTPFMEQYRTFKSDLQAVNADLADLLSVGASLPGVSENTFRSWEQSRQRLKEQLLEETLRVAVIGAIKSGKSTFLNAMLKGDYLKRGAGVVTSIVTRIRNGSAKSARLYFKTWEEVNHEVQDALALLPPLNPLSEKEPFDIRNERMRSRLQTALAALPPERLIAEGRRNLSTVLLSCYLNGYDKVAAELNDGRAFEEFNASAFVEHWRYVGDDALAVYLKDIQLEIDNSDLDSDTEFADCQGSDSPNPMHLAMIQDYLQLSHLNIYLISSRTGLREADIKFLSIIRKMGILDSVIYVVNCDLSEHESLADLQNLVSRIREELAFLNSHPQIYCFSALFNLFRNLGDDLPEKDQARLRQWTRQDELNRFSQNQWERFDGDLKRRLLSERTRLLLKNQVERHSVILAALDDWLRINRELVNRDEKDAGDILNRLQVHRQHIDQIKAMIETTTAGVVPKIKNELGIDVNRFFDTRSGECVGKVLDFIRRYQVDYQRYEKSLQAVGFLNTLYLVFQEFKQALDATMAEIVYPEVVRFARTAEKKIQAHFVSIYEPYDGIIVQNHGEMNTMMRDLGIAGARGAENRRMALPGVDAVKEETNLKLPALVAFLRYSARIKTEAFLNLGFFSLVKAFRKLLKKNDSPGSQTQVKALHRGVKRMKQLTGESILYQCKDYRENIKFKYLFKLVDEMGRRLSETLSDQFQSVGTETAVMMGQLKDRRAEKEQTVAKLAEMADLAASAMDRTTRLRRQIERLEN